MIGNVQMTAGRWLALGLVVATVAVFLHYAATQIMLWTTEGAIKGGGTLVAVLLVLAHLYHYWSETTRASE